MWPFKRKKKVDLDDLQTLVDSLQGMIGGLEEDVDRAIDHLTWRLDSFLRFFEEVTGYVPDASWGAPPLVSSGSPLDPYEIVAPPDAPWPRVDGCIDLPPSGPNYDPNPVDP